MNPFAAKMKSLRFVPAEWRLEPTEQFVADFEKKLALKLPGDYREFLLHFGGYFGSGRAPCLEPTPFGETGCFDGFYGFMPADWRAYDVRWATRAFGEAPNFVAIALGSMDGCMVVLKTKGRGEGAVYFHDADQRALWTDEQFRQMFPNLSPKIERYLELRRKKALPKKPAGYDSLFLLGKSFTEFIETLHPDPNSDEEE